MNNVHFSSANEEWQTPPQVFQFYDQQFHFDLDAAASHENALCANYFTKDNNALEQDWSRYNNIWLNPPYGRKKLGEFIAKAYDASRDGSTVVCLVPARTDTEWFQEYGMKATEIFFIKGRLKFSNSQNSAPFPSCILIFRNIAFHRKYLDKALIPRKGKPYFDTVAF